MTNFSTPYQSLKVAVVRAASQKGLTIALRLWPGQKQGKDMFEFTQAWKRTRPHLSLCGRNTIRFFPPLRLPADTPVTITLPDGFRSLNSITTTKKGILNPTHMKETQKKKTRRTWKQTKRYWQSSDGITVYKTKVKFDGLELTQKELSVLYGKCCSALNVQKLLK
jgi:hypothetical protein